MDWELVRWGVRMMLGSCGSYRQNFGVGFNGLLKRKAQI